MKPDVNSVRVHGVITSFQWMVCSWAVGSLYHIYQFLDWNYCGLAKAFTSCLRKEKKLSWNLSARLATQIILEVEVSAIPPKPPFLRPSPLTTPKGPIVFLKVLVARV